MAFAQKNYQQTQGISGRYSIASIGCFLTAFCNLEADYGNDIAPDTLDNYFRDNDIYIDVDDGIRDDLGWDSVTRYDSATTVGHTADHGTDRTAGWPTTNQSIVRFYYKSIQSGQMIFHFCKVADASSSLILDSWDGQVKKSPYGEPTAWAEYKHGNPAVTPPYTLEDITPKQIKITKDTGIYNIDIANFDDMAAHPVVGAIKDQIWTVSVVVHHNNGYTYYLQNRDNHAGFNTLDCDNYTPPPPRPPDAPLPIPTSTEPYEIVKTIMGFATSNSAANHTDAKAIVDAGTYYVFNTRANSDSKVIALNVTKTTGKPGSWINPDDNVLDPEPPKAHPVTLEQIIQNRTPDSYKEPTPVAEPIPVTVKQNWQSGYKPYPGGPVWYVALDDFLMRDVEGKRPDASVREDQRILLAGWFTGPDGRPYGRPEEAIRDKRTGLERRWWYGVPLDRQYVTLLANVDTRTSLQERQATHTLTTLDYINLAIERIGKVMDIFSPKELFKEHKENKK